MNTPAKLPVPTKLLNRVSFRHVNVVEIPAPAATKPA
jgi:hypothetical protein